ncbi:hypothetical protein IV37_GL000145 [Fructilactobacillus fructivorans]|uniref:helix-turn-helix domain-containing protein n=1 Tax=Fructilactobacillus fructivorans TaxID=1614 RepID=UPI000704CDCD|nr:helix-turn-helix domain-containing protein [Fructilactobacillus fructivorans]KRN13428.1 hypothetical protein IV37_GL000145 [Fructilactobacillus fructivorans]
MDNLRNKNTHFGSQIKKIRELKKFTIRQAALQGGISNSYLSQVENEKRDVPKPATLEKIAKGLRVPKEEIFELAGFKQNDSNNPNWATDSDVKELDKFLESNGEMTYKGVELSKSQRERVNQILTQVFWDELKKDKKMRGNNNGKNE